jgi:hypothetical protein
VRRSLGHHLRDAHPATSRCSSTRDRPLCVGPSQPWPPPSRRSSNERARLVENIEDLNRIAKIAFDGDARARALFNKDILLRAKKSAKQATTSPTPDAPSAEKDATTSPSASSGTSKTATLEPQSAHV